MKQRHILIRSWWTLFCLMVSGGLLGTYLGSGWNNTSWGAVIGMLAGFSVYIVLVWSVMRDEVER